MLRLALISLAIALPALADTAPDPVALEQLVIQDCGSCHGLTLKGGLGPDIRPQSIDYYEPDVLQSVILDGIPGTAMPPWRPLLTEDDAAWIAQFLLEGKAP